MAGTSYTRQSSFSDGDTISSSLFNNEYNKLVNAFSYASSGTTGHRHDGTAAEGGNIHTIGDQDFLNKVVADSSNNRWGFFVEVSSSAVEQIRIQDGAVVPVTDNDIDLGTSSLEFKDAYFDGTVTTDALVADTADINGGSVDGATLGTNSAITQAVIDNININGTTIGHTSDTDLITLTSGVVTVAGELDATTLDISGNADIDGTTNLDIVDIDGAVQVDGTITVGVDDTGYDVKFFGATASAYMHWDESEDDLILTGVSRLGVGTAPDVRLHIQENGEPPAEGMFILESNSSSRQLRIQPPTDSDNGWIDFRGGNLLFLDDGTEVLRFQAGVSTFAGEVEAASLDISGDVDVDGTLETDALSINGTAVSSTAAELNILDGVTSTAAELNILDGKAFLDEDNMASNSATGIASQQSIKAYVDTQITAEDLDITTDSGTIAIDLDSETLTVSGGTGLDSSATGNAVTLAIDSTVATLTGSQTLTNKSLTAPTLTGTSVVASLDISGDIDVDGTTNLDVVDIDGAVDMASTLAIGGAATLSAGGTIAGEQILYFRDAQIYIRSTVDGQLDLVADTEIEITATTIDINGAINASGEIIAASLDISGNIDVNGTTNLNAVDIDGAVQIDSTVTVGVDDTGYDVKFFGATASAYMLWDESADDLILAGAARVVVPASGLVIGSTAVTSTAAELNVLDPALKENSSIWIGSDPTGNTGYGAASYNTAIGVEAGEELTTGDYNTAVGFRAGGGASGAAVTAGSNTSVGAEALQVVTTGDLNVAVGANALRSNVLGDRNVAIGSGALYYANPASKAEMYNVAIGLNAAFKLTTGVQNTFVGGIAGTEITTGDYNTHVGYNSGGAASAIAYTGEYNTSIGINSLSKIRAASNNTAIGFGSLENLSSASNNTAVGGAALQVLTSGEGNVAVGGYAGDAITSAGLNTLVGYASGTSLTTSQSNVAFGHSALYSATTGDLNTAIGYKVLYDNTIGDRNTAIGYEALRDLEPASNADMYNVALGFKAGTPASAGTAFTGVQNTLLGSFAGAEITSGDYNTVVGHKAGGGASAAAASGNYNTALGYTASQNTTTGTKNVAVGAFALQKTTEGANSVAIGYGALEDNLTGADNVAIGENALNANVDDDGSVAVGRNALRVANNTGADAISYNTALGTNSGYNVTLGTQNTLLGYAAGFGVTEGLSNSCLGINAGYGLTTGDNNLFLGKDAGRTGSPGGNITTGDNEIVLGDENISEAHIQVDWTVASDARDKTDFTALGLGLDFVKALKPVTYKWDKRSKYGDKTADGYDLNAQTPDGTHKEDWLDIGFKAQDVEALEIAAGYNKDNKTNLVSSHSGDGKQMGLQYSKFVPILVKALQEQQALIESLTARITTLEG